MRRISRQCELPEWAAETPAAANRLCAICRNHSDAITPCPGCRADIDVSLCFDPPNTLAGEFDPVTGSPVSCGADVRDHEYGRRAPPAATIRHAAAGT